MKWISTQSSAYSPYALHARGKESVSLALVVDSILTALKVVVPVIAYDHHGAERERKDHTFMRLKEIWT